MKKNYSFLSSKELLYIILVTVLAIYVYIPPSNNCVREGFNAKKEIKKIKKRTTKTINKKLKQFRKTILNEVLKKVNDIIIKILLTITYAVPIPAIGKQLRKAIKDNDKNPGTAIASMFGVLIGLGIKIILFFLVLVIAVIVLIIGIIMGIINFILMFIRFLFPSTIKPRVLSLEGQMQQLKQLQRNNLAQGTFTSSQLADYMAKTDDKIQSIKRTD